MSQLALNVKSRKTGKQNAKAIRRNGQVPGNYYVNGQEPIAFTAEMLDLRPLVHTSETHLVNLIVDGEDKNRQCILKDTQFDPVTDKLKHIDLLGLVEGHKVTISVPVILTGASVGVKEGGIIQQSIHKLTLACLPKDIPSDIKVDISALNIGESVYLKDLAVENVEFGMSDSAALVSIIAPRVSSDVAAVGDEGEGEAAEGEAEAASEE